MKTLGLVWLLSAGPVLGAGKDVLSSLEGNPSPAATEEVSALYKRTQDPFARLWLVDVLYGRVRQHGDAGALEALVKASQDRHPDVRRRAVNSLDSFRFLPERSVRETWLARLSQAASAAEKDKAPGVRGAGLELRQSIERWEGEPARREPASRREAPGEPWDWRRTAGVLVWMVAFQILAFLWQRLAVCVLAPTPGWEALRGAWRAWLDRPVLFLYPLAAVSGVTLVVGVSAARLLVSFALSQESFLPGIQSIILAGLFYAAAGLAAFLPAAVLSGALAREAGTAEGLWAATRAALARAPGFAALGLDLLFFEWPRELAARWTGRVPARWPGRTGVPLAGALAAALMVRRNLGWRAALREASSLFPGAGDEPSAELLGRPLGQPATAVLILSAPTLSALAVPPAVALVGFSPSRMFGLWFITDSAFAVGFGLWAGALLSVVGLTVLCSLSAVHAAAEAARRG